MKKLLLVVGVIFMISCTEETAEDLFPPPPPLSDSTVVSFRTNVQPIIQQNCLTGCHQPGGSGNGLLTNYMQVKGKVDDGSFRNRVIVQSNMPAPLGLPQNQKDIIERWLDQGAKMN